MSKRLFTRNEYTESERAQFEAALLGYDQRNSVGQLKIGQKLVGQITKITDKEYTLFAYGKCDIQIPATSREQLILNGSAIGDKVSVILTHVGDTNDGFVAIGSVADSFQQELQVYLDHCVKARTVLTGIPVSANHAGYLVKINISEQEHEFFMPHLLTSVNKLADPSSIIGKEIEVLLDSSMKDGQPQYVVSHKRYLETLIPEKIKELKRGDRLEGEVTGYKDFGIFVQFNQCLTGMIHKTKLDSGAILNGESIPFLIKDIVGQTVYLSQVEKESLWDSIYTGQTLTGTVHSVKDIGLFVSLDYETRGLLHSSVLTSSLDSYQKGQKLEVVVVAINKAKRQITLNLK